MDKPEFGRIIWGKFVDTRGRLARPHRAVIITSNDDIQAGKPIRVVVISSNLQMSNKENMVLLPYLACEGGHVHTKLKSKCAAICDWMPLVERQHITEFGGWVKGKWMCQILERVHALEEDQSAQF